MGRLLLVFALVAVSCTGTAADEATTSTAPDDSRLAILDQDGNVLVISPDGSNVAEVTENAGRTAVYTQPTWSTDGEYLAWGQVTPEGAALGVHDLDAGVTSLTGMTNPPFYLSWSPEGSSLGVLHNGEEGLDFELVDPIGPTAEVVSTGVPFYFSWEPSGDRVVSHIGESRFEIIARDGSTTELAPTSSSYLAPQWTPGGILHIDNRSLVQEAADGTRVAIVDVEGLTMFVANDRASHVAVQSLTGDGGITVSLVDHVVTRPNAVSVVDIEEDSVIEVSLVPAVAFFWSPDGDSLLLMTPSPTTRGLDLTVWDIDGSTARCVVFVPSQTLAEEVLPFFPQYAQSLSLWSPDSSAFAYPGQVGEESGIWVQQLDEDGPKRVSAGGWVDWSP